MHISKLALIILLAGSLVANAALSVLLVQQVNSSHAQEQQIQQALRVLYFRNLFDQHVLLAEQEVDFKNRLDLETTVRELHDTEILAQWEKFTNSPNSGEAREAAKQLITLLIHKSTF